MLSTCSPTISKLEQIETLGELRVATINSPTTYYQSGDGTTGFEYDLARKFADELNVRLRMKVYPTPADCLKAVSRQQVHLAAANLSITDQRARDLLFSPGIREVIPKLVYHLGSGKPKTLNSLDAPIELPTDSAHIELLTRLKAEHPNLEWVTVDDASAEDVLVSVGEGQAKFTVADSDLIAMTSRYYPKIYEVFDVGEPIRKAWAFRHHRDSSLFNAATRFLTEQQDNGELAKLNDRYFGHVDRMDFVSSNTLAKHIDKRLPKYRKLFEQAGKDTGIDWRLLAAVSYQESHWDPKAKSVTGVRGLMMLTKDTAKFLNVQDRRDPAQSIDGGARYLRFLMDKLPAEIPMPDRVWMMLASYNLGFGHLLDVRRLTESLGGDPNSWVDVRGNLRLLTQSKWYSKTKYGYARGREAEVYVGNVRAYFDVLSWMSKQDGSSEPSELATPPMSPSELLPSSPLEIELPVL